MEELMPSIGTSVPTPAVLALTLCQSESSVQNIGLVFTNPSNIQTSLAEDPSDSQASLTEDDTLSKILNKDIDTVPKTCLISISDDGKIWNWLLTSDRGKRYTIYILYFGNF